MPLGRPGEILGVGDYSFVQELILSHLSMSDAAVFLRLLGLLDDQKWYRRYMSPVRYLPEQAKWTQSMLDEKHTVLIVGEDVERLKTPLSFRERPLRIWLAVRRSLSVSKSRAKRGRITSIIPSGRTPQTRIGRLDIGNQAECIQHSCRLAYGLLPFRRSYHPGSFILSPSARITPPQGPFGR
jgi:hypothetical protein